MKKLLSVVLTVAMLLSAGSVFAEDASLGFGAEVQTETEGIYRELKTHEDGNLIASVVVPASVFEGGVESAKLYVASYGAAGELSTVSVKDVTSADAGKEVKTPSIEVKDSDIVRAFIWDGTNITPIANSKTLPKKETQFNLTFENYEKGAITVDGSTIASAACATVVDDPDSANEHGQVLKLLGDYNTETLTAGTRANLGVYELLKNTLGVWNSAERKSRGMLAVDYEFDIYVPSTYAYQDADGNDLKYDVMYDFQFGEYAMASLRFAFGKDGNRFIVYDKHESNKRVFDKSGYTTLHDRWIPVKIETRPYFETGVDENGNKVETVKEEYSEIFVYFDNELVYHKLDSSATAYTTALTNNSWRGCEGRIYISCAAGANYSYSRAIYIDNFRASF